MGTAVETDGGSALVEDGRLQAISQRTQARKRRTTTC
jgi:hypothetical protein